MTTILATMTEAEVTRLATRIETIAEDLHAPLDIIPQFSERLSSRVSICLLLPAAHIPIDELESTPAESIASQIEN